jgi:hypothetical protein
VNDWDKIRTVTNVEKRTLLWGTNAEDMEYWKWCSYRELITDMTWWR